MERLGEDGEIPLGIDREHRYANTTVAFARDELLLVCTDGVLEARDARGAMFGLERLEALLAAAPPEPAAIVARVREALFAHQGGPLGSDDQSLIVLRQVG